MDRRRFLQSAAGLGVAYTLPLTVSRQLFAASLPSDLTSLSAIDLSIAIREKQASSVEVMQAYLNRIHRYNPVYNAIISMVNDDELITDLFYLTENVAGEQHGASTAPA